MNRRVVEIIKPTKARGGRAKSDLKTKSKTFHSCLECPKVFVKFGQLVAHRRRVHSVPVTQKNVRNVNLTGISGAPQSSLRSIFRCHGCKGLFSTRQQLSQHVQSCRKRPLKILRSCNTCNFKSFDEKEFLLHIKNEHTVIRSVSNGLVRMTTPSKNPKPVASRGPIVVPILKSKTLLLNTKDENGKSSIPECVKCTRNGKSLTFKSETERQRHLNEVHNVFHCHICHTPAVNGLAGLHKHLETEHSNDEKDLALGSVIVVDEDSPVAQDEAEGVENLPNLGDRYCKEIVPQTVNPKKYKHLHRCVECKYMTYHGQNLVRHMNSFHTPYACPVCSRLCKGKKNAIQHLREYHNIDGKEHFPVASHCSKAKSTLYNAEHLFLQEEEEEQSLDPDHIVFSVAPSKPPIDAITPPSPVEEPQVVNHPNVDLIMRQAFEKVMEERSASGPCHSVEKCSLLPTNENLAFWELQLC